MVFVSSLTLSDPVFVWPFPPPPFPMWFIASPAKGVGLSIIEAFGVLSLLIDIRTHFSIKMSRALNHNNHHHGDVQKVSAIAFRDNYHLTQPSMILRKSSPHGVEQRQTFH